MLDRVLIILLFSATICSCQNENEQDLDEIEILSWQDLTSHTSEFDRKRVRLVGIIIHMGSQETIRNAEIIDDNPPQKIC